MNYKNGTTVNNNVATASRMVPARATRSRTHRHALCVYPYRVESLGGAGWPPLGLELIAGVLKHHADKTDVVDLRCEQKHTIDFVRDDTDLVCFSVNWDRQLSTVREEIRSVPPHILTVVGGRHATTDPEAWLTECPNVDVVVRGDGEEVIEPIARGVAFDQIAGISFKVDGRIVHNSAHTCTPAMDLYPDRSLRRYRYTLDLGRVKGRGFDTMATSRGCPYNCKFCSFSRNPWGEKRRWTGRTPTSVVNELEEIDADIVGFLDDVFTHDPDRVAAICDLIIARGIRKRYVVNARLEIARRPDVVRKMAQAGFSILMLGIESAQDRTLRQMGKGFNTDQAREYFRVLRKSGMLLLGFFIVGNIGESEREMKQIVPFARELGVDFLNLCGLRNEKHSGLDELIAKTPDYHTATDGSGAIYSDKYSVEHLRSLQLRLLRKFYTPGHVLRVVKRALRNKIITPGMLARVPLWLMGEVLRPRRTGSAWGTGQAL
jgi:radical SAM superfamily enzyme YgiQ (UPF0313 family)